jgi:hypothetical protein
MVFKQLLTFFKACCSIILTLRVQFQTLLAPIENVEKCCRQVSKTSHNLQNKIKTIKTCNFKRMSQLITQLKLKFKIAPDGKIAPFLSRV